MSTELELSPFREDIFVEILTAMRPAKDPISVLCTWCNAQPGAICTESDGKKPYKRGFHANRKDAADPDRHLRAQIEVDNRMRALGYTHRVHLGIDPGPEFMARGVYQHEYSFYTRGAPTMSTIAAVVFERGGPAAGCVHHTICIASIADLRGAIERLRERIRLTEMEIQAIEGAKQ